jgi:hypothetical protein
MKHNIEINFTTEHCWHISATINGQSIEVTQDQIFGQIDLEDSTHIVINFAGKDSVKNPEMTLSIDSLFIDFIEITPALYSGVYYTDHPDYPMISPCTDINLNGQWHLKFDKNIMNNTLKKYLGINNE